MNDSAAVSLQYFILIAEQKKKNKFLSLLSERGAKMIQTVYAHGSMSPSAIAAAFGFEAEQGKVLITCLVKTAEARALVDILRSDFKFDRPNTGIAFGISVEGLGF